MPATRIIQMLPAADSYNEGTDYAGTVIGGSFMDVFPNSNAYGGSPSISLAEAWRDSAYDYLTETVDPFCCKSSPLGDGSMGFGGAVKCSYGKATCQRTWGMKLYATVRFEAPPVLVLTKRLTFHAWADISGQGS